jgi:anti-sigma regulatory factor (Ser/Thr protein kinase)
VADIKRLVKYESFKNRIIFPERIAIGALPQFAAAIQEWADRKPGACLTLDFSKVIKAFANGMLGVIAIVADLRLLGNEITIIPPELPIPGKFFRSTNWAHLLDPVHFSESTQARRRQFIRQFSAFEELPSLLEGFMEIVMRHMEMPGDILAALEWSANEICDNVINHSNSAPGGFLQVIAYPDNDIIAFTVADAGKGILNSLKEGFPKLQTDVEALGEAIKAGITRNRAYGMGNGLAGTQRITTMTGGSLDILSGSGRLTIIEPETPPYLQQAARSFKGTCVSGQIRISHDFSISKALTFGTVPYMPYTIVDAKYELPHEDALHLKMAEQAIGTGSRSAGREMRIKLLNLIAAKPGYPIYLDWVNVSVIASSFADEFMGKLYLRLGKERIDQTIRNIEIEPLVAQLIAKAIAERAAYPQEDEKY